MDKKTTVLMIMDGFGLTDTREGNAVLAASTPVLDALMARCPFEKGHASGLHVGLPEGQMGNSEVGHLNMGAGRVVYQELTRITKSVADGDFFSNKRLVQAMKRCKERGDLHLCGLLSDGGVHSHNGHLYALLEMARRNGLRNVYVHAFLDGRDTPPQSGRGYLAELEQKMVEIGVGRVATVMGRYYAMDRDNRWERVQRAYDAMVSGSGNAADTVGQCIEDSYAQNVNDEFVVPTVIMRGGKPTAKVKADDSVIFFNFRPDRARELTRAFVDEDFGKFLRPEGFFPLTFVCFTEYDATMPGVQVAFEPESLTRTLGEYLAELGKTQLRIAETEKYAHVTFFFNGGVEPPNLGEDRVLVASPKVPTYDAQPEMSAVEVTDKLVESIFSRKYDLIVVNYANCDMVGHTGVFEAAVEAVETVDRCVGRVTDAVEKTGGQMFICADHGNAEKEIDYETKEPHTAHTTNPVPFILVNCPGASGLAKDGKLSDIAPTLLDMMGIPQPAAMTGRSLLIK